MRSFWIEAGRRLFSRIASVDHLAARKPADLEADGGRAQGGDVEKGVEGGFEGTGSGGRASRRAGAPAQWAP